jgi:hypothetical protein
MGQQRGDLCAPVSKLLAVIAGMTVISIVSSALRGPDEQKN